MELGLQNRVAMVSAASKGIGKGIAKSLVREGCLVSICARSQDALQEAREDLIKENPGARVLAFSCDVSKPDELKNWHSATVRELGDVDILVTNTGGPPPGRFSEITEEKWKLGVESTLMNVIRLCNLVLPGMKERGWGRIVHITSLAAKQPIDILTISNTLRAGISALTKTMSNEFAASGICVNALLPGHILTDRQMELNQIKAKERGITVDEYAKRSQSHIPAGRYGTTREIGDVVAFLCSDRASYVSGVSLQVDGGLIKSTF